LGVVFFCSALSASAQVLVQPTTADTAWQGVLTLGSFPTVGGTTPTLAQEITQLQQEAQMAKAFYKAYPSDSRADTAKKVEALSGLQEVQLGAVGVQAAALAVATAFVNDASKAVQDRYDIALASELITQASTLEGLGPADNGPAYEAVADSLYAQFGDVAPAYGYYLSLTMSADNATAAKIASKIQTMNAPAWAKAQAQIVVNRAALVGNPVSLTLTSTTGQAIDLSQPSGQTTVVYLWGGAGSMNDLAILNSIKASVPTGVRWIYVALNSPSPVLSAVQAAAPIPGTQCFDPVNLGGWVPQTLFLQMTPYAYVFKANGTLSGYGSPLLIPALLNAASQ
jgi:hypothetical protein